MSWALQFNASYDPPRTFLSGVRELPGGHALLIERGMACEARRWYSLRPDRARAEAADPGASAAELRRLLQESVRLHLRSDVPVGTCLSGGLDSSAIVALASAALAGARLNSFSVVYPVKGYDESAFVGLVADRFQTLSHVVTPRPGDDFLARLSRMVWHQELPVLATGVVSQDAVMRAAAGKVTVLLDGQGADELLGGYLGHAFVHYRALLRTQPARWALDFPAFALRARANYLPGLDFREFAAMALNVLQHGRDARHFLTPELEALAYVQQARRTLDVLPDADALNQHLYQAVTCLSLPTLLHYEDRSSMAYGIEARVPFLDHRLVEFALGIPAMQKIRGRRASASCGGR